MTIYVPRGVDPQNDREALALSELQFQTATTNERRRGHWISIHSRRWRQLLGSRYKSTITQLAQRGYIEVNDRYSAGRFAMSYRLAKAFRGPLTQPYVASSTPQASRIRLRPEDSVGHQLARQFSRVRLAKSPQGWDGYCAAQMRCGSYYASRCEFGRFHSSFTGLRRESRAHLLTTEGHALIEIDVRNCQPLLLGTLITQQQQTQQDTTNNNNNTNNTTQTPTTICGAQNDLRDYLEVCERGWLYDHLARLCEGRLTLRQTIPRERWHRFGTDRALSRKDVKRQFLIMLFAPVATTKKMPLFDVFGTEFPTVADFVLAAKRERHQDLACRCQRLESELMIDAVCGECFRTCPDAVLVTIHDAILTPSGSLPMVASMIRNEFLKLGITPTLNVTTY